MSRLLMAALVAVGLIAGTAAGAGPLQVHAWRQPLARTFTYFTTDGTHPTAVPSELFPPTQRSRCACTLPPRSRKLLFTTVQTIRAIPERSA